jgi:hypothetical protein
MSREISGLTPPGFQKIPEWSRFTRPGQEGFSRQGVSPKGNFAWRHGFF